MLFQKQVLPALAVENVPMPAQQVQSIKIISEPAIAANVSVVWDVSPPVQKVSDFLIILSRHFLLAVD